MISWRVVPPPLPDAVSSTPERPRPSHAVLTLPLLVLGLALGAQAPRLAGVGEEAPGEVARRVATSPGAAAAPRAASERPPSLPPSAPNGPAVRDESRESRLASRQATAPEPDVAFTLDEFPLETLRAFRRSWGDPRPGGRTHLGADIPAPKGTPVVAAADGRVRWMHDEKGGRCCAVALVHDGGWRTRYLHLNNDTPGTDDGRGYGIREDLERGSRVEAGELIGWVGDSGNAETTISHLHFELRDPRGRPVDPHPALEAAAQERERNPEVPIP